MRLAFRATGARTYCFVTFHGQPALVPVELGEVPVLNAPDSSDPPRDENDELFSCALDLASRGAVQEVEEKIFPLLDSGVPAIASRAAHPIGKIRLQDEQYSASTSAFRRALEWSDDPIFTELVAEDLRVALAVMNSHYGEGGPVEASLFCFTYDQLSASQRVEKKL